jgi:Dolichyl-phosphate-mannose-protein mannosyltransferase
MDEQVAVQDQDLATPATAAPPEKAHSVRFGTLLVFFAVWIACDAYAALNLRRGWIPHDEGTYATCAERVLKGQLPHRDFHDMYGGGLTMLHAAAFRALGVDLFPIREVLFVFFLASVPATFWIARRFANPIAAGAVTLLACAWGVPNYSAAEPSWYNLFFAIFGTAALLRYIETNSRWWIFAAGVCVGLSILAKITGLYFLAGALLFLVYQEQVERKTVPPDITGGPHRYRWFVIAGLFLFLGVLTRTIQDTVPYLYHFVLPGAALAMFLMLNEVRAAGGEDRSRFVALGRMLIPLGVGLMLPILLFLVPYFLSGSVAAVLRGWFVLPMKHLSFTVVRPHGEIFPVLLLGLVTCVGAYLRGKSRIIYSVVIAAALIILLKATAISPEAYRQTWRSVALSIPVTVLCGIWLLHRMKNDGEQSNLRRQQLMLLLCVTAVCSLIQFPFSAPIYFCYVAALWILALLAFFSAVKEPPRLLLGSLLSFFLLFAVLRVKPTFLFFMGVQYQPDTQTRTFMLPRAGALRVDAENAQTYESLIPLVQRHAGGGFIYAAPDCPEVYFLSGLGDPSGVLFDFFDDPANRTERILKTIEQHAVKVVVLNNSTYFSRPIAKDLREALTTRFPYSTTVGRFDVRWTQ